MSSVSQQVTTDVIQQAQVQLSNVVIGDVVSIQTTLRPIIKKFLKRLHKLTHTTYPFDLRAFNQRLDHDLTLGQAHTLVQQVQKWLMVVQADLDGHLKWLQTNIDDPDLVSLLALVMDEHDPLELTQDQTEFLEPLEHHLVSSMLGHFFLGYRVWSRFDLSDDRLLYTTAILTQWDDELVHHVITLPNRVVWIKDVDAASLNTIVCFDYDHQEFKTLAGLNRPDLRKQIKLQLTWYQANFYAAKQVAPLTKQSSLADFEQINDGHLNQLHELLMQFVIDVDEL